jgi:DNA-3-methyladenine glycosylase II
VKGIGRWTAQMFLMFSLGRPDVFPHDDLGIRSAIKNLYGLSELPDRQTSHAIAEPWRPYATVASWYCWRSLDLAKRDAVR